MTWARGEHDLNKVVVEKQECDYQDVESGLWHLLTGVNCERRVLGLPWPSSG